MGVSLVGTLTTDAEKLRTVPFMAWLRAATQRDEHTTKSVLNQVLVATTPDRQVTSWLHDRLRAYRLPSLPVPPVFPVTGALPGVVPITVVTSATYTEIESDTIMASCSLDDTQWDTHLPPFFGRLLEEGRKSSAKAKAILAALTKP